MLETIIEFNDFLGELYAKLIRTEKFELDQIEIIKEKFLKFENFDTTQINQEVIIVGEGTLYAGKKVEGEIW